MTYTPVTYNTTNTQYTEPTGSGWGTTTGSGYHTRYSNDAAASGLWTITGLAAGSYLIAIGYASNSNRTTDARHVVKDGSTTLGTIEIDQTLDLYSSYPNQYTDQSALYATAFGRYANLGQFDISSGTLTVRSTNQAGANYLVNDTIYILYLGPVGTKVTVVPSTWTHSANSIVRMELVAANPLGLQAFAWNLIGNGTGGSDPSYWVSPAVDTYNGDTQGVVRFYPQSTTGNEEVTIGLRCGSTTAFQTGYYCFTSFDSGGKSVRISRYNGGTAIVLASSSVAFNLAHYYELRFYVTGFSGSTLAISATLQDITTGQYVDESGNFSTLKTPFAAFEDHYEYGTLIDGPGYQILSSYVGAASSSTTQLPAQIESFTVSQCPDVGGIATNPLCYAPRFDRGGNKVKQWMPKYVWDESQLCYWMTGSDGTGTIIGGNYPANTNIRIYRVSPDLTTYTDCGVVLNTKVGSTQYDWLIRSYLFLHPVSGLWTLIANGLIGYVTDCACIVIQATTVQGLITSPTIVSEGIKPSGYGTYLTDHSIFVDGTSVYLILGSIVTHNVLQYATFNNAMTTLSAATNFSIGSPGGGSQGCEAPFLWKRNGLYYAGYSAVSGWSANQNYISSGSTFPGSLVAQTYPFTTATQMGGQPDAGGWSNSYNSQCVSILQTPSGEDYWVANRNNNADFGNGLTLILPVVYTAGVPTLPFFSAFTSAPKTSVVAGGNTFSVLGSSFIRGSQ